MSKTIQALLSGRKWIAHIDDERSSGNSILVTLSNGWFFADEPDCGVRGYETFAELRSDTKRANVVFRSYEVR